MTKFEQAIQEITKAGGRPFMIGGFVRDEVLGVQSKDLDIEVFGLTTDQLIAALSKVGSPIIDDRKFGVIRLDCGLDWAVEFSLPRKDNATGERGFGGVFPDLSAFEAAKRRDFTFNAMSKNLITGEIVDPLGGLKDLMSGIIRHCDDVLFGTDPLRGVRGFRFAGQIDAKATPETAEVVRALVPEIAALAPEAMWSEFEKWAKRSIKPSRGLDFLVDTGMIVIFPEIETMIGLQQDPKWHPEGDVFAHTRHVVDAAAGKGVIAVLAALCHDMGKATTTVRHPETDRWVSPKHAQKGEAPTRSFLARIGAPKKVVEAVVEIVKEHMTHMGKDPITKTQARRLLVRLENASPADLFAVIEADHYCRPPLPVLFPERAQDLKDLCFEVENEIKPMVMGRHLQALGMKGGPHFGPILDAAFEAQIEGAFSNADAGVTWLKIQQII